MCLNNRHFISIHDNCTRAQTVATSEARHYWDLRHDGQIAMLLSMFQRIPRTDLHCHCLTLTAVSAARNNRQPRRTGNVAVNT